MRRSSVLLIALLGCGSSSSDVDSDGAPTVDGANAAPDAHRDDATVPYSAQLSVLYFSHGDRISSRIREKNCDNTFVGPCRLSVCMPTPSTDSVGTITFDADSEMVQTFEPLRGAPTRANRRGRLAARFASSPLEPRWPALT